MKRIICLLLALLLAIPSTAAFALTQAAPPGTTPVKLNITPLTFKATVPIGLPFDLDASGITRPATEASIINNSMGPIKVVSITTEATTNWKLTNYTDDFTNKKVNSKDLALQLNTDKVQSNGGITLTPHNWPTIEGNGNLRLDYQGKFAPQEEAITATVAHVSFVIDWDGAKEPESKYIMATDELFSGTKDGEFLYIGSNDYVEVPHIIKGVPVTNYNLMFAGTSVKGVKSTNKNITTMSWMFYNNQSASLDVSELYTANVTNMSYMFYDSLSKTLDLSNFNTSKVTNMRKIFANSRITNLDVSNFDTSNVIDMSYMFESIRSTSLNLTKFDTSKVIVMNNMFASNKLTSLDISNFNTSNVINMSAMFESSNLTILDLSKLDTSNVTTMSKMFNNSKIIDIDLSTFDMSNVTNMSAMFMSSQATTIKLNNFDTSKATTTRDMFNNSKTKELDLSSFNIDTVTITNDMFKNSLATTGYARTQPDADKLNASSNKPTGLIFEIK